MIPELVLEKKPPHGSPDWLAARHRDDKGRARLTASVAGVLFGTHEFISGADLAVQQLKDEPPSEATSEAMDRGRALEPGLIAEWARRTGEAVAIPDEMFCRGRWLANLDGLAEGPVEAKTTRKRWGGELPGYWRWQGVAQAWCVYGGPGRVDWSILDGDLRIHTHVQHVSQDEIDVLLAAGDEWLLYIDIGMVPPNVELGADHVTALHRGTGMGESVEIGQNGRYLAITLATMRAQRKKLEDGERKVKDELARLLGGRETGTCNGEKVVTWREYPGRPSFDRAAFRREYPELAEKFEKVGESYRRMIVKGESDDDE